MGWGRGVLVIVLVGCSSFGSSPDAPADASAGIPNDGGEGPSLRDMSVAQSPGYTLDLHRPSAQPGDVIFATAYTHGAQPFALPAGWRAIDQGAPACGGGGN